MFGRALGLPKPNPSKKYSGKKGTIYSTEHGYSPVE